LPAPQINNFKEFTVAKKKQDINALMKDLSGKDGIIRNKARIALVEIGGPAVEPLVNALTDRSQTVRWESAKALGQIMDPRSIDALVNALQDRLFDVRWLAAEGLIAIGSKSVKPLLQAPTISFMTCAGDDTETS
jgi:HEAT repeat protein